MDIIWKIINIIGKFFLLSFIFFMGLFTIMSFYDAIFGSKEVPIWMGFLSLFVTLSILHAYLFATNRLKWFEKWFKKFLKSKKDKLKK